MKLNKHLLIGAAALSLGMGINETQAQNKVYSKNGEICQVLGENETLVRNRKNLKEITNHEEFINTNIFELKEIYGKERCLKLINWHALVEINNIRETYGRPALHIDENLRKFSQNRAKYLFESQSLSHGEGEENLANRLNREGIQRTFCGENLGQGQMTIKRIIQGRMGSENHKKLLLDDYIQLMGLGVDFTNIDEKTFTLCSTRVMTAIGND